MAWTYSGDPAGSALDKVRFLCGDVDTTNEQLNDAEILFLLSEWNNDAYVSAACACDAIAGKYQSKADSSRSIGDLSISTQNQAVSKGFQDRASSLRAQALRASPPSVNFDKVVFDGTYAFEIDMDGYVQP